MPFPERPRAIFEQNPIAKVICQLRFPPILEISTTQPAEFQKRLRADYPLYGRQEAMGLPKEIAPLVSGIPLSVPQAILHNFSTADSKRTIALNSDFLALSEARNVQ